MPETDKSTYRDTVVRKVEEAKTIEGENFRRAILRGIKLPQHSALKGCDFREANLTGAILQRVNFQGCDFSKATLKDCHCEYSDFRGINTLMRDADVRESHFNGALLQNVDLTGSDLRDAIFIDADMIGAMLQGAELYAARLLNTRLRKENLCNFRRVSTRQICIGDERSREKDGRELTPLRARYVYSALKNNFRSVGEYADERWARFKERKMERKRLFRLGFSGDRYCDALALEHWLPTDRNRLFESRLAASVKWVWRWFLTLVGYGEEPVRFLGMSVCTIIVFSFLFMFAGFEYTAGDTSIVINRDSSLVISELDGTLQDLGTSFYLSVVTFTTLGYGDAHPIERTRYWAATEALLGLLAYSAFVATFLKRLSDE